MMLANVLENFPHEAPLSATPIFEVHGWRVSAEVFGDEQRYILERRYAKKFPGNMLERPSLLLNPWAIRSTETSQQQPQ